MPQANPAALDFLLTRRSPPAKMLGLPVPDRATLETILTAASRVPDHGKLEPWRFVVLERAALSAMADQVTAQATATGIDPDKANKARGDFEQAHLAVVVVESPKASEKIPAVEQTYSTGAVCLSLLNAALASGWGANWLTGWPSRDPAITAWLGLTGEERIAGILHLGTEKNAPPERPRPDVASLTTWFKA